MRWRPLTQLRCTAELAKTRADCEQIADMLRMCSDGIDQKSTAHIPELPEAAVAKASLPKQRMLCVIEIH